MEYHPTSASAPTSSPSSSASFAGKTLVIPVVSHGNVGQLASDLMVNTASLPRLGCLDHPALLPCVGCGAFSAYAEEHQLALGMEVYGGGNDAGLVVAQQRAEVVLGAQRDFARATAEWIASVGFAEVIIMASMPSTAGVAPGQIGGTRFRHITTTGSSDPRFEKAELTTLESEITPCSLFAAEDDEAAESEEEGGEGKKLPPLLPPWSLLRACKAAGVKATCALAICSEGDNSADAAAMADAVSSALGAFQGESPAGAVAEAEADGKGGGRGKGREQRGARIGRWAVPPSWAAAYGAQPMNRAIFI